MLIAESFSFQGRHGQLVPPTSLRVAPGQMLLLVGEPQDARTAASLILSGRMKPTEGGVRWGQNPQLSHLRSNSAIVDSPNINEPEPHLKVRDIVSEDLSLLPTPIWRQPHPKRWMQRHGFEDLTNEWADAVDPARMTDLLVKLAVENAKTKLLVIDSPDRHQTEDEVWLELLEEYTFGDEPHAVIAVVSRVPDCWTGPVAFLGYHEQPEVDAPQDEQDDASALAPQPMTEDPAETEIEPVSEPAEVFEADATDTLPLIDEPETPDQQPEDIQPSEPLATPATESIEKQD